MLGGQLERSVWNPLRDALARGLTSRAARERFAPAMSYGRHFGPDLVSTRPAAVMALFCQRDGEWFLPFTIRPAALRHHGGQVSLAGGAANPGESPEETALRETQEELGIDARRIRLLGRLSSSYLYVSDFRVTPCVGWLEGEFTPRPDPIEVAGVVELPVAQLLNPARCVSVRILEGQVATASSERLEVAAMTAPAIEAGDLCIWGATAIILGELIEMLSGIWPPQYMDSH